MIQAIGLIVTIYCTARLLQMTEEASRSKRSLLLTLMFVAALIAVVYLGFGLLTAQIPTLPGSQ